jgi:hypothetical protein
MTNALIIVDLLSGAFGLIPIARPAPSPSIVPLELRRLAEFCCNPFVPMVCLGSFQKEKVKSIRLLAKNPASNEKTIANSAEAA